MKKVLLIAACVLFGNVIFAQKGLTDFEVKLYNFKYSLYEDIENYEYEEMQSFEFFKEGEPLRKKVDGFIIENKKEIMKYQNTILAKYEIFDIDTSQFEADTLFNEFADVYNASTAEIDARLGDFYKINPLIYITTLTNMLTAQKYSALELGLKSLKNTIAWPRTATKKIEKNKWFIFFDEYNTAFLFKFDVSEMEYEIIGIYERKD